MFFFYSSVTFCCLLHEKKKKNLLIVKNSKIFEFGNNWSSEKKSLLEKWFLLLKCFWGHICIHNFVSLHICPSLPFNYKLTFLMFFNHYLYSYLCLSCSCCHVSFNIAFCESILFIMGCFYPEFHFSFHFLCLL